MSKKAYIGIDPGKTGAACLLAPDKISLHDWAGEAKAAKKLSDWNAEFDLSVVIEHVNSFKSDGHAFAFRFGVNFGIWRGICAALFIKPALIYPATWQSLYLPGWNKKGVDNKQTAIEVAQRLYPAIKNVVYLKKHNGRADALLLADLAKRRGSNGTKTTRRP